MRTIQQAFPLVQAVGGLALALLLVAAPVADAAVRYVDVSSPSPTPPFTNWATAARVIQDAVDLAVAGDEVVVTNGTYATGGRRWGTNLLVSRVAVDKALTLRSVNGPQVTLIQGYKVPGGFLGCGNGAVRCVALASGATLTGFTLTNGATRMEGDLALEQSGGGVGCVSPTAVVSNCVLAGNGAWFGGGASSGTLYDCVFTNNSARTNGGGASESTLERCILVNNTTRFGDGGGGYACTMKDCMLASNLAHDAVGGGAMESTLVRCTLSGNYATWAGGGAFFTVLEDCVLTNNSSDAGGGAYYCTLTNCTLVANSARAGGGSYGGTLDGCTLSRNRATGSNYWTGGGGAGGGTLVNCLLDHNTSASSGGGVTGELGMEGSPLAYLINCVLRANSAQLGGGAHQGNLYNCTLTENSANSGGGANGSRLLNCIVYSNSAPSAANFSTAYLDHCCTWPMPVSGAGNLTNLPQLVSDASGNLRLQSNSPCINAGNNAWLSFRGNNGEIIHNGADRDGDPRVAGGTVDIGAYEFQSPSSAISYAWLQGYGLPTDGSVDFVDADADGQNTWQEWRCQTDPTNALSALRLVSVVPAGPTVLVSWRSVAGVTYRVERSTNLLAKPAFAALATNVVGSGGVTLFADTNGVDARARFYRVGVP